MAEIGKTKFIVEKNEINKNNFSITLVKQSNLELIGGIEFDITTYIDLVTNTIDIDSFMNNNTSEFFNIINFKDKIIYLKFLFVEDKFKKMGFANKLLTYFIDFIYTKYGNSDMEYIVLNALPFAYGKKIANLDVLIKLYEKFDFETFYVNKKLGINLMLRNI